MKTNKKEQVKEKSFIKKIFESPAKLNNIAMLFIVVCYLIIAAVAITIVSNNEDYVVIPQYEEAGYSDELNVAVKVISNYSETDGELVKKDSMIMYAYAERTKKVVGLEGRISTLHKDGTMYYHSDKIPSYKDYITSNSTYLVNGKSFDSNIKTLFGNFQYQYPEGSETKTRTIQFKENLISLTKKDLNSELVNDFKTETYTYLSGETEKVQKLFPSFTVTVDNSGEDKKEPQEINIIYSIPSVMKGKYHLDLQMFIVKDGKSYPLAGWYNLSTSVLSSYNQKATVPYNFEGDYVIVKANMTDPNGDNHTLLYKESVENLLK